MESEINKPASDNKIYLRFIKFWLSGILVFLPFQIKLATYISPWNNRLSTLINNLDEVTIVIFLLLSIGEFYKQRRLPDKIFFF